MPAGLQTSPSYQATTVSLLCWPRPFVVVTVPIWPEKLCVAIPGKTVAPLAGPVKLQVVCTHAGLDAASELMPGKGQTAGGGGGLSVQELQADHTTGSHVPELLQVCVPVRNRWASSEPAGQASAAFGTDCVEPGTQLPHELVFQLDQSAHAPQPVPVQLRDRLRDSLPKPVLQVRNSSSKEAPAQPQLVPFQLRPLGQLQAEASHPDHADHDAPEHVRLRVSSPSRPPEQARESDALPEQPQVEVSQPDHAPHAPHPVGVQDRERSRVCWPTPTLQLADSSSVALPTQVQLLPSQPNPALHAQPESSHAVHPPHVPPA